MKTRFPLDRAALAALAFAAYAGMPAQAQTSPPAAATPMTVDAVRQAAKDDKRGLVEKNMQLTADEAKAFWPIYDDYQKQMDDIVKRQNRAVLDYVNATGSLSDANAKRIVESFLKAEADEQKLTDKTVRTLMGKLPALKAARFMQIENKLRALYRFDVAQQVPLAR